MSAQVLSSFPFIDTGSGLGGGASSADQVSYDNTASGLSSTDVQDAIDELAASITSGLLVLTQEGTPTIAQVTANLTAIWRKPSTNKVYLVHNYLDIIFLVELSNNT